MYISTAICTYNRADSLADTMEHLCQLQEASGLEWELLLIDNNCSDNTAEVAELFRQRLPLRYIVEKKQGLSHARNRAVKEAAGDLLVFTDDDIRVSPGWLRAYQEAFNRYPDAGYFGGPIRPFWPNGKPGWLLDENMPVLGSGIFGFYNIDDEMRYYQDQDLHPFGANFALTRNLFEKSGCFRVDLGVKGKGVGRGEEAEYFRRAKRDGVRGVYVPNALVCHRVDRKDLTLKRLYRYGIAKGVASKIMSDKQESVFTLQIQVEFLVKGLYQLLINRRGDRFRQCVVNMGIQRGLSRRIIG